MKYLILFLISSIFYSCWPKPKPGYRAEKVWGWKAILGADTIFKKMTFFDTAVKMDKPGKIYIKGNIIYQSDLGKGIHIIDNRDPATEKRVAFIGLPGNSDLSVKGNFMYANNYDDIVVLDISNPAGPKEVNRLKHKFITVDGNKPFIWITPPGPGPAACFNYYQDSVVTGWRKDSIYTCFYF